jgi:hypothetical protein
VTVRGFLSAHIHPTIKTVIKTVRLPNTTNGQIILLLHLRLISRTYRIGGASGMPISKWSIPDRLDLNCLIFLEKGNPLWNGRRLMSDYVVDRCLCKVLVGTSFSAESLKV